jgi:hypothetical protein
MDMIFFHPDRIRAGSEAESIFKTSPPGSQTWSIHAFKEASFKMKKTPLIILHSLP